MGGGTVVQEGRVILAPGSDRRPKWRNPKVDQLNRITGGQGTYRITETLQRVLKNANIYDAIEEKGKGGGLR
ncbi:hypothetical protein HY988_03590 [Candidatus Micrarchaeota archaeon]|nr:hypothetical protein [Candidatus Micrarchaeota archaeon]